MATGKRSWRWVIVISAIHAVIHFAAIVVVLVAANPHGGGGGDPITWVAIVVACFLALPVAWLPFVIPVEGLQTVAFLFIPVNSFLWGIGMEWLARRLIKRSPAREADSLAPRTKRL